MKKSKPAYTRKFDGKEYKLIRTGLKKKTLKEGCRIMKKAKHQGKTAYSTRVVKVGNSPYYAAYYRRKD